ncbi:putative alpha-1,2-mannosidase [Promicromonospora sp. AC04]|uniref:GH92 family glycosyl hydrolase n=1 Tax=Promicromonospora sp. AC04 TaxID=2135723 RepID=UPI000D367EFD|nr:GH92 family glycosyl hydrolase [Promicromonospora sp. AC04]PUB31553.1 putative alpha-1,2-mannosidase [Promicromonospora sp. AC04]
MTGPAHVPAGRPGVGLTSEDAHLVRHDGAGRTVVLDGLDVPVEAGTELRYTLLPVLDEELTYRATYVAVDLLLDDGKWLSQTGPGRELRDQHGMPATAVGQGEARILVPDHWNLVRVDLGPVAERAPGRRVRAAAVVTAPPHGGRSEVWLDAVTVGPRQARAITGRTDLVDTRRGTHSSSAYSRGNTVPAAAVPNGFTMWVPLTDASSDRWLYSWAAHNGPDNRPRLQGVGISHEPSPWMGDRDQLAFHLVPARADGGSGVDSGGGSGDGSTVTAGGEDVPDAALAARAIGFSHDDEIARPHLYTVDLDGGARVAVAASDHGGVLRFTFPPGAATGHLLIDAVSDTGADGAPVAVTVHDDGTFTGWSDHGSALSVGRSRMYVVGRISRPVLRTGRARGRDHATYATVALDPVERPAAGPDAGPDTTAGPDAEAGRTVEVRVATSYISEDLAWRALEREAAGTFDEVAERARAQWEERLGVLDVEGATEEQQVTLWSNLYRLNLYPSSYTEVGADGAPVHASPVLDGAPVVPGEMFVNHGFWDTYRTCWPAYALLYPEVAARLADGFVQQYREGGWVARWSSPGYADLMTGTSSDVAFADLYLRGVDLPDPLATYDAGLRNATALPTRSGVGRKGQDFALTNGWVPRDVEESVSWSLEGYINDAGLARMAEALADAPGTPDGRRRQLRDEAAYLRQSALGYVHLFDPETGFFRGRGRDGAFGSGAAAVAGSDATGPDAAAFDPDEWGGDYTESDAWNFLFHPVHDGAGLARLHGGPDGLERLLDRFFATPERADKPGTYGSAIHEMFEARDVRLGQLGQSNQVSHHIPYAWLFAGRPDRTQETVREILARLWTGNEIGQGYHGDEDNGEMSAWYVLSALGLYPLEIGSPRWAVTSPLFERTVVHRPDGDLVIEAPGAADHWYVAGLDVSGGAGDGAGADAAAVRAVTTPSIDNRDLVGGAALRFALSGTPTRWGVPSSGDSDVAPAGPWQRADGSWHGARGPLPRLTDGDLTTSVEVTGSLEWRPSDEVPPGAALRAYTLTSSAAGEGRPPSAWRLVTDDGRVLDERTGEHWPWPGQLRPFVLDEPAPLTGLRLELLDEGVLAQVELLAS